MSQLTFRSSRSHKQLQMIKSNFNCFTFVDTSAMEDVKYCCIPFIHPTSVIPVA